MAKRKVIGTCRLCGKTERLTFEHIPPGATYNKQSVRMVRLMDLIKAESLENALPWELNRMPYTISQKGRGEYCLCEKCNNITGTWYGVHYKKFIDAFMYVYQSIKDENVCQVTLELKDMRPLPILKQVLTMFCDINPTLAQNDQSLKEYLLDKENKEINTDKYRIFMYLMKGGIEKTAGLTAKCQFGQSVPLYLSEIATVPVGFILYKDLPKDYETNLTEITNFTQHEYSSVAPIEMKVNALEVNSWIPGDFRSKKEIATLIEKTNHENQ